MRWLDGITDAMGMNLGKLWKMVRERETGVPQSMGLQRMGHDWATEQLHEECELTKERLCRGPVHIDFCEA